MSKLTSYIMEKQSSEKNAGIKDIAMAGYGLAKKGLGGLNSARKYVFDAPVNAMAGPMNKPQGWGGYLNAQFNPKHFKDTIMANVKNPLGAVSESLGMKNKYVDRLYSTLQKSKHKDLSDYATYQRSLVNQEDSLFGKGIGLGFGSVGIAAPIAGLKDTYDRYQSGEIGAAGVAGNVASNALFSMAGPGMQGFLGATALDYISPQTEVGQFQKSDIGKANLVGNIAKPMVQQLSQMPRPV